MSADRKLLELAAKAAGFIEFTWNVEPRARKPNGVASYWNPLDDDGDALRLAMKLCIPVEAVRSFPLKDRYATTRRAIVCAAAEIGRAMA